MKVSPPKRTLHKDICIALLFSFLISCSAQSIDLNYRDKIVKAIYIAEGGAKTKYPFGIKSINTNGDYNKAKRICENTVSNNWIRWIKAGKTNDFISFLGSRYAPIGSPDDPRNLNSNWVKNVNFYLKK